MPQLNLSTAALLAAAPDVSEPMPIAPELRPLAEETVRAAEVPILLEKPAPRPPSLPVPGPAAHPKD
jgi:hypothetical protein